jgi:short-subunit dehydrogenase
MVAKGVGKTVIITGASSGIGLAAALEYARHGWRVGLIARGEPALRAAEAMVEAAGGTAHVAVADVADAAALRRAAGEIEQVLGPADVWINNAGIGFYGRFVDVPEAAFRRVMEVNFFGTVNGTRIALEGMRARNRGTIVQVLSAVSFIGVPLQSAYASSKFALRGFCEAVRGELVNERSAVHVTLVHPPAVNTPFYSHAGSVMEAAPRPPPPVYQPELLGEAMYLAGISRRRDWKVTGATVAFAAGNAVAPNVLDHLAGLMGVGAQKTRRERVVAARDPNIFAPSIRPARTHGPFDGEALGFSLQWALMKSPRVVGLGLGVLAVGALAGVARGRRRRVG